MRLIRWSLCCTQRNERISHEYSKQKICNENQRHQSICSSWKSHWIFSRKIVRAKIKFVIWNARNVTVPSNASSIDSELNNNACNQDSMHEEEKAKSDLNARINRLFIANPFANDENSVAICKCNEMHRFVLFLNRCVVYIEIHSSKSKLSLYMSSLFIIRV